MSLWSMIAGPGPNKAQNIKWRQSARGEFYRLMMMEQDEIEAMRGLGGVLVMWHGGISPAWIYAGQTDDMADTLMRLKRNQNVRQYEVNGGIFVTWSPIVSEFRDGVVNYLVMKTIPMINSDYDEDQDPIPVLLPG